VVVATTLAACGFGHVNSSGFVSLEYVRISASDIVFELKNGSSKKISFRGVYSTMNGADPWDSQVVCREMSGTSGYAHPIALDVNKPASINISSGGQMRLRIGNQITAVDKDARCHLRLKLGDGVVIESGEFPP
jgi:hypothetical protein